MTTWIFRLGLSYEYDSIPRMNLIRDYYTTSKKSPRNVQGNIERQIAKDLGVSWRLIHVYWSDIEEVKK